MPIVTRCPACSETYKLADEAIGRQAKCKCGHLFIVARATGIPATPIPAREPIAPSVRPASTPVHMAGETEQRASPRKARWPWIAGATAVALVVVGIVLALSLSGRGRKPGVLADAEAPSPGTTLRKVDRATPLASTKQPAGVRPDSTVSTLPVKQESAAIAEPVVQRPATRAVARGTPSATDLEARNPRSPVSRPVGPAPFASVELAAASSTAAPEQERESRFPRDIYTNPNFRVCLQQVGWFRQEDGAWDISETTQSGSVAVLVRCQSLGDRTTTTGVPTISHGGKPSHDAQVLQLKLMGYDNKGRGVQVLAPVQEMTNFNTLRTKGETYDLMVVLDRSQLKGSGKTRDVESFVVSGLFDLPPILVEFPLP